MVVAAEVAAAAGADPQAFEGNLKRFRKARFVRVARLAFFRAAVGEQWVQRTRGFRGSVQGGS